jgi:hypothetical protein
MIASRPGGAPVTAQLYSPLARLLRPLVRLLIGSGITFPILSDLLRELYVNVAEHEFPLTGKMQTDSRVSLLTGIHRKEVRRLRGAGTPVHTIPQALSQSSRIVAVWLGDPSYCNTRGKPAPLRKAGEAPSFESLVEMVTRDVRPRAVLDDWLNRGLVTTDVQDRVVLVEAGVIPASGDDQLYYFGRNLHDHIAAAVANVIGDRPRHLERAVHYDGLSAKAVRRLEERARELAMEALQAANREAHQTVLADSGGSHRWTFGAYIFTEQRQDTATPEDAGA